MIIREKDFPVRDLETPSFICLDTVKRIWSFSKTIAESKGGTLVSINCIRQNDQVQKMITTNTFIGGTDADNEGVWKWTDGTDFKFTNWNDGEPNGGKIHWSGQIGDQDCSQMSSTNGRWDDVYCHHYLNVQSAMYQSNTPIDGLTCEPYFRKSL